MNRQSKAILRRVALALVFTLPVLAAACLGYGIVASNRGALLIGIAATVLVPAASLGIYFIREERLET